MNYTSKEVQEEIKKWADDNYGNVISINKESWAIKDLIERF